MIGWYNVGGYYYNICQNKYCLNTAGLAIDYISVIVISQLQTFVFIIRTGE